MSAPKHTPGPWHATGTGIVKDEQGRSLAIIQAPRGEIPLAEAVENGELMASAPDLAARIAALDTLLAEKQRQCDLLTDALDAEVNKNVRLRNALKATLQDLEHTARPELHDDPAWAGRDSRKLAIATLGERRAK